MKEYIKGDLKFPLSKIDQNFLKKIEKTSAASAKKPRLADEKVEEARPSECSTDAPAEPPLKTQRFRKLVATAS